MTDPLILGQLGNLHDMMRELVTSVPPAEANARYHPKLATLSWYLARSVYRETYWLREVIAKDPDLTRRVRGLFTPNDLDLDNQCNRLPPADHLLSWAREIHDEHLRRLATPGELPDHPLLRADRMQWFLLQETARDYETMLSLLLARSLSQPQPKHQVREPLSLHSPTFERVEVIQGHYRIGSRDEAFAYDNELPPQAVELSSFRIAKRPVNNAAYLTFMEAGGYERKELWSEEGRGWLSQTEASAPWQWRRDLDGHWYEMGLNGPADLATEEPVAGINQYEAAAFAAWVASLGGDLTGAVLQHEYQWEVAARSGVIEDTGRVWEWCANALHPYPDFAAFPNGEVSQASFGGGSVSLRGASLHTQRCLRRASFRNWAPPHSRHLFTGIRLVFPPT